MVCLQSGLDVIGRGFLEILQRLLRVELIRPPMIFLLSRGKRPRKSDVHYGVCLQAFRLVLVREGQGQVGSSEFHQAVIEPCGDRLVAGIVQGDQQLSVAIELDIDGKDFQAWAASALLTPRQSSLAARLEILFVRACPITFWPEPVPVVPTGPATPKTKKPTWWKPRRRSTTSAYLSTNPPAQPGCSLSSHPTMLLVSCAKSWP